MEPIPGYDDWKCRLPNEDHFEDCPCCEEWDSLCICAQIEADYVEGAGEDLFEQRIDK